MKQTKMQRKQKFTIRNYTEDEWIDMTSVSGLYRAGAVDKLLDAAVERIVYRLFIMKNDTTNAMTCLSRHKDMIHDARVSNVIAREHSFRLP